MSQLRASVAGDEFCTHVLGLVRVRRTHEQLYHELCPPGSKGARLERVRVADRLTSLVTDSDGARFRARSSEMLWVDDERLATDGDEVYRIAMRLAPVLKRTV